MQSGLICEISTVLLSLGGMSVFSAMKYTELVFAYVILLEGIWHFFFWWWCAHLLSPEKRHVEGIWHTVPF